MIGNRMGMVQKGSVDEGLGQCIATFGGITHESRQGQVSPFVSAQTITVLSEILGIDTSDAQTVARSISRELGKMHEALGNMSSFDPQQLLDFASQTQKAISALQLAKAGVILFPGVSDYKQAHHFSDGTGVLEFERSFVERRLLGDTKLEGHSPLLDLTTLKPIMSSGKVLSSCQGAFRSPDGRRFLFVNSDENNGIHVIEIPNAGQGEPIFHDLESELGLQQAEVLRIFTLKNNGIVILVGHTNAEGGIDSVKAVDITDGVKSLHTGELADTYISDLESVVTDGVGIYAAFRKTDDNIRVLRIEGQKIVNTGQHVANLITGADLTPDVVYSSPPMVGEASSAIYVYTWKSEIQPQLPTSKTYVQLTVGKGGSRNIIEYPNGQTLSAQSRPQNETVQVLEPNKTQELDLNGITIKPNTLFRLPDGKCYMAAVLGKDCKDFAFVPVPEEA